MLSRPVQALQGTVLRGVIVAGAFTTTETLLFRLKSWKRKSFDDNSISWRPSTPGRANNLSPSIASATDLASIPPSSALTTPTTTPVASFSVPEDVFGTGRLNADSPITRGFSAALAIPLPDFETRMEALRDLCLNVMHRATRGEENDALLVQRASIGGLFDSNNSFDDSVLENDHSSSPVPHPELQALISSFDGEQTIDGVDMRTGKLPNSDSSWPVVCGRMRKMNATPKQIIQALSEAQNYPKMDEMCERAEYVEQVDDQTAIVHQRFKSVWPVSPRDYCQAVKWWQLSDDSYCFMTSSTEDPRMPPQRSHVRAKLNFSVYHVVGLPDGGSDVSLMFHGDLGGTFGAMAGRVSNFITMQAVPKIIKGVEREAQRQPA